MLHSAGFNIMTRDAAEDYSDSKRGVLCLNNLKEDIVVFLSQNVLNSGNFFHDLCRYILY